MAQLDKIVDIRKVITNLKKRQKKSTERRVIVGYTANYALWVHESIDMVMAGEPRPKDRGLYWDPQGQAQAKFLEGPARTHRAELAKITARVYATTGDMGLALYAAGLRLQRESQKLVPVDTGNLKASAVTRIIK